MSWYKVTEVDIWVKITRRYVKHGEGLGQRRMFSEGAGVTIDVILKVWRMIRSWDTRVIYGYMQYLT